MAACILPPPLPLPPGSPQMRKPHLPPMKNEEMKEKTPYKKLLLDPRWQKKRLEILSRDSFECQCCGDDTKTLHVHHLHYEKNRSPWDYQNQSLVTLCEDCHSEEHRTRYAAEQDLLAEIRMLGLKSDTVSYLAYVLSSFRGKTPESASSALYAAVSVLSWCEMKEDALNEFISFSADLQERHRS